MIQIHRRQPVVRVNERAVRLSRAEHQLLATLGMMDNKVVPGELLLETAPGTWSPAVLWGQIARLRKKIGPDRIQHKRGLGYMLVGDVRFYG